MVLLALSTGHKVGLAVVGAAFVTFALSSALLLPRIWPNFPGRGLPAFIIVAFVFFFGMLTAVEVFGAEPKEKAAAAAPTTTPPQTTPSAAPQTIHVTESEFKIAMPRIALLAGPVTFQIRNAGKLAHDLAIVGGPKSNLIQPGGTGTLHATLKAGPIELYCTVPGHRQAGMDVKATVVPRAAAAKPPPPTTTTPTAPSAAKPQTVQVTEKEFKITLVPPALHAGPVTFQIKNTGAIPHDLAIVGGPKSNLIQPGGTGTLHATLKAGPIELYCTVPGHRQAGMDVKTTVVPSAAAATKPATTTTTATPAAKPQTVQVTEKEFKITLVPAALHAGLVTFQIKNTGALPHDLAIVGGPKSRLIQPGGTGTLQTTLKAGPIELYCSVPGHKQAGMDVKTTVS